MKAPAAMILLLATIVTAWSGPSSPPGTFNPAITRQDFTGQGTYHRAGLIREQNRALAAQKAASQRTVQPARPSFLTRFWQSLFRKKPKTANPSAS